MSTAWNDHFRDRVYFEHYRPFFYRDPPLISIMGHSTMHIGNMTVDLPTVAAIRITEGDGNQHNI
jgi:hypothetical protein